MCLKISSQFLVKPMAHICNLSLPHGIFPKQLKIANHNLYIEVLILWCSSTIDLYYVLSQIFEKVMCNRVTAFIEIFQMLHCNQYGFRKKSPTHVAFLTFIDKVIKAIGIREYPIGVLWIFRRPLTLLTIKLCWINYIIIESEAVPFLVQKLLESQSIVCYLQWKSSWSTADKVWGATRVCLGPLLFLYLYK